jgi:predicted hydrolase (HD superfamily)
MSTPSRERALALLHEYVKNENLIRHALAVEAVMRLMARLHDENEAVWGAVGLVHDIDYERWPTEHCLHAPQILREAGWPEDDIRAVLSHGWGVCTDVEPVTTMEKTLYAVDELTGLIAAAALVRPSKSVLDLEVKSVKKKWKEKAFAAGADRSVIERGAEMLGMDVWELVRHAIDGMQEVAAAIGLEGEPRAEG